MIDLSGFPTLGIVGSAGYSNIKLIQETVKLVATINPDTIIVSGRGGNVDNTAERQAIESKLNTLIFPAQWDRYEHKRAGFVRNEYIARASLCLLAFWDGKSNGTKSTLAYFYEQKQDKTLRLIVPDVHADAPKEEKQHVWQNIKAFLLSNLAVSAEESS